MKEPGFVPGGSLTRLPVVRTATTLRTQLTDATYWQHADLALGSDLKPASASTVTKK
jgi:hypothetical protein